MSAMATITSAAVAICSLLGVILVLESAVADALQDPDTSMRGTPIRRDPPIPHKQAIPDQASMTHVVTALNDLICAGHS